MKANAACIVLVLFFMAGQGLASGDAPAVISPGNGAGVTAVEGGCPTFSWSGVPWAKKYRVAVFLVEGGARALVGEMKLATSPVLSQETAAGGSSWTPGADQALADGQEYAWCVGALDADGAWTWSDLARFRVDGSARRMPAEERQAEAERRALESGGLPQGGGAAAGDAGNRKSPKEESRSVQGSEGALSTFYGLGAGANNSADTNANSFFGSGAGYANTSGLFNTFVGTQAGFLNNIASGNTFLGYVAGHSNTAGDFNTFIGRSAGYSNTTGEANTFLGYNAGYSNTTGYGNTFLGLSTGYFNQIGLNNVFLGYNAGFHETGSNKLYIDSNGTTAPLIYGEFDNDLLRVNGTLETTRTGVNNVLSVTRTDGASFKLSAMGASGQLGTVSAHPVNLMTNNVKRLTVAVSGNVGIGVTQPSYPLHMASGAHCTAGGVWTNASSLALKENIAVLGVDEAATALRTLNPVKYNYKADASERCVGFIAEEVPELVAQNDRNGLSPMDIVAVLTKVVQEQQKAVQEQQKMAHEQQEEISLLKARLSALERKATGNK